MECTLYLPSGTSFCDRAVHVLLVAKIGTKTKEYPADCDSSVPRAKCLKPITASCSASLLYFFFSVFTGAQKCAAHFIVHFLLSSKYVLKCNESGTVNDAKPQLLLKKMWPLNFNKSKPACCQHNFSLHFGTTFSWYSAPYFYESPTLFLWF